MADNRNTVAGTSDGVALTPTNGSPFMDYLTGLTKVGFGALDRYSTFYETKEALKLANQIAVSKPQQTVPAQLMNSPADFFSDPARTQKTILYITGGAMLLIGAIILFKKL